jgi:hypothetical protein
MSNIYINDFLGSTSNSSNVIMYADDTSILISNNCYEKLNRNFNKVLYNTLRWFQNSQLVLNMEKTKIVKFTPENLSYSSLHITFAEQLPVKTNAVTFLGLQLDNQLSWKPHINYVLHKLSSVCFIMRLSHILIIQTLKTVYFAHFHSLVNYGIIFWYNKICVCKLFLKKIIILEISSRSSCRKCFKKLDIR